MEPNNIETLIKTTIKERRIEPSADARKRLIEALNSKPENKKKPWIRYSIAASLMLLLSIVGGRLLMENLEVKQPIEVTIQKDKPELKQQKSPLFNNKSKTVVGGKEVKFNTGIVEQIDLKTNPKFSDQTSNKYTQRRIDETKNKSDSKIGDVLQGLANGTLEKNENSEPIVLVEKDSFGIKTPKQYLYITSERLLAEIENDSSIERSKIIRKVSRTYIDSDKLLVEIEKQVFDDKNKSIFKKAGRQMKKIKEALADRNYQN